VLLEREDEEADEEGENAAFCARSECLEKVSDLDELGFGGMRILSCRGYEQVHGRAVPSCSSSGSARGSR